MAGHRPALDFVDRSLAGLVCLELILESTIELAVSGGDRSAVDGGVEDATDLHQQSIDLGFDHRRAGAATGDRGLVDVDEFA